MTNFTKTCPAHLSMLHDENAIAQLFESPSSKPRLLIVDDQPINIQVMYQIFAGQYQVFMATKGAQAIDFCRRTPPDLILLDVVMPEMDGFEVCSALKADPATRDIPIIFVTAHTESAQETRGIEAGAVDFITKPVNPAVVRARVKAQLTLKFQSDLMRKLVFLDGLTSVFNRRYFDQQLAIEMARAIRAHTPMALIMLDVDFFKRYNDHYSHQTGDDCLRQVAHTLKESLRRPADLVARYGGEEFVCILPDTAFADALNIAAELEANVRLKAMPHADSSVASVVTVSLGVAGFSGQWPAQASALLALADAQLYAAKHAGRARACGAELTP